MIFPFSLFSQTTPSDTTKAETYVRPSVQKGHSNANQKTIKLLKKEKHKAEKVSKNLKSKAKGPNASLSSLETEIVNKTDQRVDSLSKVIETKKGGKHQKKVNKEKDKLASEGKQLKNEKLNKGKQQVVSKLKENEEAKEVEEKLGKADLKLPDSSGIISNENLRLAKDLQRWKEMPIDSLKEDLKDSVKNRAVAEAKQRGAEEAMKVKEVGEGKQIFDQVKAYKTDSASADKIAEDIIQKTEYGKDLGKLNGNQDGLTAAKEQSDKLNNEAKALQEIQDKEQMQRYAKEKAAKLGNADLAKIAPQIQEAQQQFTQYKKKMEWVKEGSGENANSLKDEDFKKRIIYGGNFQIPELDPFSIVVAPFVGYRINKKFSSGISFSYKTTIGKNDLKTKSFGGEMGYRVFTDYKLIKNWFVHGEFERLSKTIKNTDKDGYYTTWQNN